MPSDNKEELREDKFSMEVSKVRWLAIMLKPQRDSKGVVFSFSTLLYPELYQAVSTAYLEWGKRSGWYRFFHRSVEIVSTPIIKEQLVNVGSIGNVSSFKKATLVPTPVPRCNHCRQPIYYPKHLNGYSLF